MAEESSTTKATNRVPSFSGARKDFHIWWVRFKAYANMQRFQAALKTGGETSLPQSDDEVLDESTPAGKESTAAKMRNAKAMSKFSIAFVAQSLLAIVYKSQSTKWPEGLAHLVVVYLFKKYNPDDRISRVELWTMLNEVTMKVNKDPSTLFEQVSEIKNRYNTPQHTIDEEDLIAVVMRAAPDEYVGVITSESNAKGAKFDMDDLENVMYQQWRQTKGTKQIANEKEIALTAFDWILL
jgi:hypothetical protein